MLRRSLCALATAAAANAPTTASTPPPSPPASSAESVKMATLHKLLTGEVQLRNRTPLKVCYIEHNFGAHWRDELRRYAQTAGLSPEDKAVLQRQLARVELTRYTTRELAEYAGDGPEHLDWSAREANIAQGRAYVRDHGVDAFKAYVRAEAQNAQWSSDEADRFIAAVLTSAN